MNTFSKKPLIGVTLDCEALGEHPQHNWYKVRKNYCERIAEMGGIPFPLIHDLTLVESYMSHIDGLLITGGGHDIDPTLYGAGETHPTVTVKPGRTAFELAMARAALDKDLPLLGICGGHQVINVALGGSLVQDIPDEVPGSLNHRPTHLRHEPSHTIEILPGTLLHTIVGESIIHVNSSHHQAVRTLGRDVITNAVAPDGVIEGIEVSHKRFCLGVQWHPEYFITSHDKDIFMAFLEATNE